MPAPTILPALLLSAAAALIPADRVAIDGAVAQIFAPYRHAATSSQAISSQDYRGFSAETSALIAHWARVTPKDEVDDLSDGDWFCLCQDWDARTFRATILTREVLAPDRVQYRLRLNLGWHARRDERLVFRREARGWRLDDLYASDYPRGLKQALRETIAADEKLPK